MSDSESPNCNSSDTSEAVPSNEQMPDDAKERRLVYFDNLMSAWVLTKLEKDKSLLTLSAGGIGLLVTLLASKDSFSETVYVLYILSLLSFLLCIIFSIIIFEYNSKIVMDAVNERGDNSNLGKVFDTASVIFFSVGILFALGIGAISGYSKIKGDIHMSQKKDIDDSTLLPNNESFDGISGFRPQSDNKKTSTKQNNNNSTNKNNQNIGNK